MTILGIDPGTAIIGYGVIESDAAGFRSEAYGVIRNGRDRELAMMNTAMELKKIIETHQPDRAAVEKLFFTKNQKTAMAVSEMRGVILLTLAWHKVPVIEFTPMQVKQAVSGYGGAAKRQIQDVMRMLLKIKEPIEPDDAADALAIALCGATAQVDMSG